MMEEMVLVPLDRESSQMLSLNDNSQKNLTFCCSEDDLNRALQLQKSSEAQFQLPPSPPLAPSVLPSDDSNNKKKKKGNHKNNNSSSNTNISNNNNNSNKSQQKNKKSSIKFWQKKEKTKEPVFRELPNSACATIVQSTKDLKKYLASSGLQLVTCPNAVCGCIFEKMAAGTDIDPNLIGMNGKPLSPEATQHYLECRFRCRECNTEFCSSCLSSPYHTGYTCQQFIRSLSTKCRFCGSEVTYGSPNAVKNPMCSYCYKGKGWFTKRKMNRCARCWKFYHTKPCSITCASKTHNSSNSSTLKLAEDADRWICYHCDGMEVCGQLECQTKASRACPKKNSCGHYCIGIRDEYECPPCHHPDCERSKLGKQTSEDFCNICWVESLGSAPCIYLSCGHTFHYFCILDRLQKKWSGPSINFNYLNCPLCGVFIQHPMLAMSEDMILFSDVKRKAVEKLFAEGMINDEAVISKNGRFFGDVCAYALHVFTFYRCYYCGTAYCGGKRSCEEGAADDEQNAGFDPKSYICSTCTTRVCPIHGDQGLMFKCRFCCRVATWFCFGNTHYCDKCHETPYVYCDGKGRLYPSANNIPVCGGPDVCPLGVKHPPHGTEHALRCVLCEENSAKSVELPNIRVEAAPEGHDENLGEQKIVEVKAAELDLLEMKPYGEIIASVPAEGAESDVIALERSLLMFHAKDSPLAPLVQDLSLVRSVNKLKEKEIDCEEEQPDELRKAELANVQYQKEPTVVRSDQVCTTSKSSNSVSNSRRVKVGSRIAIKSKTIQPPPQGHDDDSTEDDSYDESCDSSDSAYFECDDDDDEEVQ
eukprot:TRINITY_DN2451_c0_g1_i2.p1 TRINITY_DN2451_c0_g1~~TRINITY_DN2451_c0_g1_i2.p1  ORF type:complete len:816 (-),score=105.06 TRINITY_DN2451_c0_g1_i2:50-2497(-)